MVTAGKYRAKAVHGMATQLGANQTWAAKVTFEILDGEHAGQTVEWTGFLSPAARDKTLEQLAVCGWQWVDGPEWVRLHGIDRNEVLIVCEARSYQANGQTRMTTEVKWVNPLRITPKLPDSAAAAAFGAQIRGSALQAVSRVTGAASAPVKPQPTPIVDDFDDAAEPEGDIDDSFDFGANVAPPPKAAVNARPNRRAGF